jgi:hypothetical protein
MMQCQRSLAVVCWFVQPGMMWVAWGLAFACSDRVAHPLGLVAVSILLPCESSWQVAR